MLCSRFKQILPPVTTKTNNIQCRCLTIPSHNLKKCRRDSLSASILRHKTDILRMSTIRFLIKDLRVYRFWSVWTRNVNVGSVGRRCRKDRMVRVVFQSFRQTFLRTPKSLLISATAAFNVDEGDDDDVPPCELNITDEDLQDLLTDLEKVQELSKSTLYCERCNLRLPIENKKISGVQYCVCREPQIPDPPEDGWVPYMEADDVIIWRKEYKPGQGLFAYKVHGRYNDVTGQDFAAIQVDGYYRKIWDSAVADLSIVERSANGVLDQAILHWEVLWPRLFANRDYVYIRRHKEFDLDGMSVTPVSVSGDKTGVSLQKPSVSEQKPYVSGEKGDVSGQKSDEASQKTEDQEKSSSDQKQSTSGKKQSSSDQKQSSLNQKENLLDQSEKPEKDVSQTTDSRGTKITITKNKPKKPVEEMETSKTSADLPVSGDNKSADKPSSEKPSADKPSVDKSSGDKTLADKPSANKPSAEKTADLPKEVERPSVHSNAKRKSQESYEKEKPIKSKANKAYVIISRSCDHPEVPPSSSVIRVTEYWSNMVIRSLEGADHVGMEFVLTYYDEPAVGGLPTAVTSLATGRAAPAFLARMRIAAKEYAHFIKNSGSSDAPDFKTRPTKISFEDKVIITEEDMESSKHGPELNEYEPEVTEYEPEVAEYKPEVTKTSERGTQTEGSCETSDREKLLKEVSHKKQEISEEIDESDKLESNDEPSWWRQIYPFYYFLS